MSSAPGIYILAVPSVYTTIEKFLHDNNHSYHISHSNFITYLYKVARSARPFSSEICTWVTAFFDQIRANPYGVSAEVYCDALKEFLEGHKSVGYPDLKGVIPEYTRWCHLTSPFAYTDMAR
jgi:hypothetical protein